MAFRDPKALGCLRPERSEGATKGLRVSKYHRPHWSRCLTDIEPSNY